MDYEIKIERAGANWFAHIPDLPGCLATGDTIDEVNQNIRTAIQNHLEALQEVEGESGTQ
jgi:predicted RNase H-like HicB family nuclease